jgi:hypothetical protein
MHLKSLEIHRNASWEANPGQFAGELTTESPAGKVTIRLTQEHCQALLAVVAKGMAETAAEASQMLLEDFHESTGQRVLEGGN